MRRGMTLTLLAACGLLLVACSEDPKPRDGGTDGTVPTEGGTPDLPGGPGLMGTVKDAKGVAVQGAMIEVGTDMAFTADDGSYTLAPLTAGDVSVKVTQDWFKEKTESATVAASGMTTLDITIEEHPLKIDPADKTLADTYNQSFDWTTDTLSIVILPTPTRKALDNAIYFRNPALFRDTSGETDITPSPQPKIESGTASNFTFQTSSSTDVLDAATIADKLSDTTLTATEQQDWMMYKPMMTWLKDWDATKIAGLNDAGTAVTQQTWGDASAVKPQAIEQVFLHGKEVWVQVVFENFVKLGAGITDSDGDGRKEVYAKLDASLYTDEVVTKLESDYVGGPTHDTHGMSKEINQSLNELYTTTAAEVEKYIAQPFEVTGVGTITYPFVVLKHSDGAQNVLLVGP